MRVKFILSSVFILCLLAAPVFSQTLKATVSVTLENLPLEKQQKLANFQMVVEEYINNSDWTNNEFDVEIPLSLQIFFRTDLSASYEDRYGIQILISDNSDVQYFDKRCRMEYQQGERLQHSDGNWDSLTSLLDFFVNILIGDQMDKMGHLMGTPYFEKAKIIAEQAKFGMGRFQDGWDLRNDLILDILSDKNLPFREMKDYFFYGLYYAEEDPNKARKYTAAAVDMIEEILSKDPENERCKKFLTAHHIELIDLFKDTDNKEIFEKLISLDPEREETYREYL
ncbi:MAG: DUF4835 family protein [candidate division KSB1 bacterium]|nr:DUF4835 family protein [candidate division KSB1 bacterium]